MRKKIILGDEYDDDLRDRLCQLLKSMGGKVVHNDWALGGSQVLETLEVALPDGNIAVEAETYIGLSISGEETQVIELAAKQSADFKAG